VRVKPLRIYCVSVPENPSSHLIEGSGVLTMVVSATDIKAAAHSRKSAGRPRLTGASGPPAFPTQRARSLPALV
jgi:hypothetical protein